MLILSRRSIQAAAVSAVVAFLWCVVWASGAPAGPDIAISAGKGTDWHLLTGWLLHSSGLMQSASTLSVLNTVGIIVVASALGAIFASTRRESRATVLAMGLCIALVISPLALPLTVDPLGFENSLTFVLYVLALTDAAEGITLHPAIRAVVLFAIVLQDFAYAPIAVIDIVAIAARSRDVKVVAPPALSVIAGFAIRLYIGVHYWTPWQSSVERVSIAAVAILLIGLPALLWIARAGQLRAAGFTGKVPRVLWVSACAMLTASIFSPNGDPSVYLFASLTAAILACFSAWQSSSESRSAVLAGTVVLLAGLLSVNFTALSPVEAASRQVTTLIGLLQRGESSLICVSGKRADVDTVVGGGVLAAYYPRLARSVIPGDNIMNCISRYPYVQRLIIVRRRAIEDEGHGGMALAVAIDRSKSAATHLSDQRITISPVRHTHMPGGRGAFVDTLRTPIGAGRQITIAAPFRVTFPCIRWQRGSTLSFAVTNPLGEAPHAGSVRFSIFDDERDVISDVLKPSAGTVNQSWLYYNVALPRLAGSCSRLAISVHAAGASGIATWASFVDLSILAPKNEVTAEHVVNGE